MECDEIVEKRETEVSNVLSKLERVAELLSKEVASVEGRLTTVVSGGAEKASSGGALSPKPREYTTDLAARINNSVDVIDNLANKLSILRNRIEL